LVNPEILKETTDPAAIIVPVDKIQFETVRVPAEELHTTDGLAQFETLVMVGDDTLIVEGTVMTMVPVYGIGLASVKEKV
jgi:hypothetical protein